MTWQNWKYTNWELTQEVTALRPLIFERRASMTVIATAPAAVLLLPYDEAANRARGFLWPWQWCWRLP